METAFGGRPIYPSGDLLASKDISNGIRRWRAAANARLDGFHPVRNWPLASAGQGDWSGLSWVGWGSVFLPFQGSIEPDTSRPR